MITSHGSGSQLSRGVFGIVGYLDLVVSQTLRWEW